MLCLGHWHSEHLVFIKTLNTDAKYLWGTWSIFLSELGGCPPDFKRKGVGNLTTFCGLQLSSKNNLEKTSPRIAQIIFNAHFQQEGVKLS